MKPSDLQHQDSEFFSTWLNLSEDVQPDIFVLNFQELVDLESHTKAASNFLPLTIEQFLGIKPKKDNSANKMKQWEDLWKLKIDQYLPLRKYRVICSKQLVGLYLLVFAVESVAERMRDIYVDTVKTGLGGYHGNKGSVSVRFLLDDSSVCFVNAHLPAHQKEVSARNQDASSILKETKFKPLLNDYTVNGGLFYALTIGDGTLVMDHESVIFAGDLNYRIDGLERDAVIQATIDENWDLLLEYDQLYLQLRTNPYFALSDFQEGSIQFAPTFKLDVGTDLYDSSDKKRIPAYCDRVWNLLLMC
jgi:hypothetical protein